MFYCVLNALAPLGADLAYLSGGGWAYRFSVVGYMRSIYVQTDRLTYKAQSDKLSWLIRLRSSTSSLCSVQAGRSSVHW